MKDSPSIAAPIWWLVLSIVLAGSMAYYVAEIWSANQPGQFSDLYAPWWGAHEILLNGRNPYSPEVAHEIQTVIYGAPVTSNSTDDPSNIAGGFAYPPYMAFLLWPTLHLSFSAAEKVLWLASVLLTLLSVALWLRALRFRLPPLAWLTIAFFALGSFPTLQGLQLLNLSLIASALIAICLFLLSTDQLVLAGILLAASTFKPQLTVGLIPWLALWSMGDWRRRRSMVWSFLTSMFVLVAISEWLVPNWISSFLRVVRAYRHYTYGHSLLDVWFTPVWGLGVATCVLIAVLAISWRYRSLGADSPLFLVVTCLVLAATLVVIPTLAPHLQLPLLPGILCLLRGRTLLSSSGALSQLVLAGTCSLLAWPWIAACGLTLAAMEFPADKLLRFWEVPLYTSPVLPLAVLVGLSCLLFATTPTGGQRFRRPDPSLARP
jgi:hypothetical protein